MNILITNDDGPDTVGLEILQRATAHYFGNGKVFTITPHKGISGTAMGTTTTKKIEDLELEEIDSGKRIFTLKGRPADVIHYVMHHADRFLPEGKTWDTIFAGVNHGSNAGFDVFTSGTVGAVMTAATAYGCGGVAFSQEGLDEIVADEGSLPGKEGFKTAESTILEVMRAVTYHAGECWNVNFPAHFPAQGLRTTKVAHYSKWRTPPTRLVPRAKDEVSDITLLREGWVTLSQLELRVNPPLRY